MSCQCLVIVHLLSLINGKLVGLRKVIRYLSIQITHDDTGMVRENTEPLLQKMTFLVYGPKFISGYRVKYNVKMIIASIPDPWSIFLP